MPIICNTVCLSLYSIDKYSLIQYTKVGIIELGDVDLKKFFTNKKTYYISFMKLIAVPVFVIGILLFIGLLVPVSDDLIIGAFIAFAMPTAGLDPTYAKMYNGDEENAVYYTFGTTILSVATIPLLYLLLTVIL